MQTRFVKSPYILAAVAIVWAGGFVLLDRVYVRPTLSRQVEQIEDDSAADWLRLSNYFLRTRREQMLSLTATWATHESTRAYLENPAGAAVPEISPESLQGQVSRLLACDGQGRLVSSWQVGQGNRMTRAKDLAAGMDLGRMSVFRTVPGSDEVSGIGDSPLGPAMFARCAVRDDNGKRLGYLVSLRPVDDSLFRELSMMVGVTVRMQEDLHLPANKPAPTFGKVVWREWDQLKGAQLFCDSEGGHLGYLVVQGEPKATYRHTRLVARVLTIDLLWATAFAVLMITVIHKVVSGPMVQLFNRVERMYQQEKGPSEPSQGSDTIGSEADAPRSGEEAPRTEAQPTASGGDEQTAILSTGLRGEALALALRFEEVLAHVEKLSATDALTEVNNRRSFQTAFLREFRRARRYNRPLSAAVMDIDFFKAVNDALGHQNGDAVLKVFARVLRDNVRASDIVGRLGGDEFAVLLPETPLEEAVRVVERIRADMAGRSVGREDMKMSPTVSAGVVDMNCRQADTPEAFLDLADQALYAAKRSGRNRVFSADRLGASDPAPGADGQERVDYLNRQVARLDAKFKRLFVDAIGALISALEARDEHTANHSAKVRRYAMLLGAAMGLPEHTIEHLARAAMLHDIGKIGLPDSVLLKEGQLDDREWELVREHPVMSVRIMEGMAFLDQEIPAVRYHHERYDGGGYPEGLSGSSIPLAARILAVADAFDAMTSSRIYRRGMPAEQALEELRRGSGTQFDPAVVDAFVTAAHTERLAEEIVAANP